MAQRHCFQNARPDPDQIPCTTSPQLPLTESTDFKQPTRLQGKVQDTSCGQENGQSPDDLMAPPLLHIKPEVSLGSGQVCVKTLSSPAHCVIEALMPDQMTTKVNVTWRWTSRVMQRRRQELAQGMGSDPEQLAGDCSVWAKPPRLHKHQQ